MSSTGKFCQLDTSQTLRASSVYIMSELEDWIKWFAYHDLPATTHRQRQETLVTISLDGFEIMNQSSSPFSLITASP